MQAGNTGAAFVVSEDVEIAAFRMNGSVIRSWNDEFPAVTRANDKWNEGSAVEQFSDAGNHAWILSLK